MSPRQITETRDSQPTELLTKLPTIRDTVSEPIPSSETTLSQSRTASRLQKAQELTSKTPSLSGSTATVRSTTSSTTMERRLFMAANWPMIATSQEAQLSS